MQLVEKSAWTRMHFRFGVYRCSIHSVETIEEKVYGIRSSNAYCAKNNTLGIWSRSLSKVQHCYFTYIHCFYPRIAHTPDVHAAHTSTITDDFVGFVAHQTETNSPYSRTQILEARQSFDTYSANFAIWHIYWISVESLFLHSWHVFMCGTFFKCVCVLVCVYEWMFRQVREIVSWQTW